MKKTVLMLAAMCTIGMAVSCSDDDDKTVSNDSEAVTPDDNDEDEDEDDSGSGAPIIDEDHPIVIDGYFNDWDAIISEEADEAEVVYCKEPDEDYNTLRNLKITSDSEYIYIYVEFATDVLYWVEGAHKGSSMTGYGVTPDSPSSSTYGPLWVYIDSDNNNRTGLYSNRVPCDGGDYAFYTNMLSDNIIQIYTWVDPSTEVWDMCWSQVLMQCAEDYGCWDDAEKFEEGNEYGHAVQEGWPATSWCTSGQGWAPSLDSTMVTDYDWFGEVGDEWSKCEFRISRDGFFTNLGEDRIYLTGDENGMVSIGLANQVDLPKKNYAWERDDEERGHLVSGIIPGSRAPLQLKLAD